MAVLKKPSQLFGFCCIGWKYIQIYGEDELLWMVIWWDSKREQLVACNGFPETVGAPAIHPSVPHNQEILLSIHQSWGRNVSLNGSKGFWHLLWSLFTNNNNYDMSLLRVVLLSFPCVTAKEGRMVRWRPSDRPDNTLKGFWSSARSRMMEWDKLSNLSHVMLLPGHFFQPQTKTWW